MTSKLPLVVMIPNGQFFSLLFGPLKPFLVKARRDCAQAGRKALQPCWIAIGFVLEICPSGARKRHFHSRIIVWTPAGESSKAIPTHPGWTVAFRSAAPSEERIESKRCRHSGNPALRRPSAATAKSFG